MPGLPASIVTLGSTGRSSLARASRSSWSRRILRGAYPVGSGDAFLGGLAVAHSRGMSMVDAARLGLAAGIANAQVPGAGELDPGDRRDPGGDHPGLDLSGDPAARIASSISSPTIPAITIAPSQRWTVQPIPPLSWSVAKYAA